MPLLKLMLGILINILFIRNKHKVARLCFYAYYIIKRDTISFSAIPEMSFTIRYLLVKEG